MQRRQKLSYVIALVLATAGIASAQDPQTQPPSQKQPAPPPSQQPSQQGTGAANEVMAEKMSVTATVDKVDKGKRQLMLKDEQGTQFKVNVPSEVTNFDAIKKGDKINVEYFSSVALALLKGEKGKAPSAEATTMVEKVPGPLPGGMVAKKMSVTAEVVKVDTSANNLTIKGPGGAIETIHVTDPAMQADLAKLKKGDKIHASYNEAVAVSVEPQQKKQKSM